MAAGGGCDLLLVGGGELRERERKIAEEALEIEALPALVQARERRR